jgi:rhodanese-related sulfurtransferase
MKEAGYAHAVDLITGFNGWKKADLPVTLH